MARGKVDAVGAWDTSAHWHVFQWWLDMEFAVLTLGAAFAAALIAVFCEPAGSIEIAMLITLLCALPYLMRYTPIY